VSPEDRALVLALRRRDAGAFDELYRRYHARIWAFLARLCGDRAEAEDLFQETWLAVARHAHRLAEDSELVAWLYTIARNQHRSARRFLLFDLRRKERFALEPMASPLPPDEAAALKARAEDVVAAFEALGEAHREVLLLSLVEGLETAQVAAVLGLREDAVRKRLSRARAELAALLETREAGGTIALAIGGEPS
jgi:RNA polymerase sigma-70 factor (ECF subfamily)